MTSPAPEIEALLESAMKSPGEQHGNKKIWRLASSLDRTDILQKLLEHSSSPGSFLAHAKAWAGPVSALWIATWEARPSYQHKQLERL